jgi:hypothetical protein
MVLPHSWYSKIWLSKQTLIYRRDFWNKKDRQMEGSKIVSKLLWIKGGIMTDRLAFQDEVYFKGNHCMGCGNENPHGFKIKSYWEGDESICTWKPEDYQTTFWPDVLYGGIISGLIDCHCMCTIIAEYNKNKR